MTAEEFQVKGQQTMQWKIIELRWYDEWLISNGKSRFAEDFETKIVTTEQLVNYGFSHDEILAYSKSFKPAEIEKKQRQETEEKDEPYRMPNPLERYKINQLARYNLKVHILKDLLFDMTVCDIEGWDKTELLDQLKELLNSFDYRSKQPLQCLIDETRPCCDHDVVRLGDIATFHRGSGITKDQLIRREDED